MTASARLRALRLVGFKSFAERTVIEFGPGISAIVGPNGSGKSNLADALRWTLGEQGRSLRTRKAEDVIFAGSARRHAIGMADVTLVIDNSDRLLPVDYGELELARRLYRSGENEYLLNRQRVRLRDLVDLLDAGNLADNAFLFIGQGMVDQALALRPEERRPLFEEVAGVRRHERRRRRAEAELAEAESNLARVRDIIAELRPQARRLAGQVQQQEARIGAGAELAAGLVATAGGRFRPADEAFRRAGEALDRARVDAARASAELRRAEAEATRLARELERHAAVEVRAREELEMLRSRATDARLEEGSVTSELAALKRDVARLAAERASAEERVVAARRVLAAPAPDRDTEAEAALAELDAQIAEAAATVARARAAADASDDRAAAIRREESTRLEAMERQRRMVAEVARRAADQRRRSDDARQIAATSRAAHETARAALAAVTESDARALAALDLAGVEAERAATALEASRAAAAAAERAVQAARDRLITLDAALEPSHEVRLISAAEPHRGRRLLDGLDVEPGLLRAVEVALGEALEAVVVPEWALPALRDQTGVLVLEDAPSADGSTSPETAAYPRGAATADELTSTSASISRRSLEAAVELGGGSLAHALLRDRDGVATRLLAQALWTPDLESALRLRPMLPLGWVVASTAGELVRANGLVRLAVRHSRLDLAAERDRLVGQLELLEEASADALRDRVAAEQAATRLREARDLAREACDATRRRLRLTEEDERIASRQAESAGREESWEQAQADRLAVERRRAEEALDAMDHEAPAVAEDASRPPRKITSSGASELAPLEQRLVALRARRETMAEGLVRDEAQRRGAEEVRRRAEIVLSIDDVRLGELAAELRRVAGESMEAEAAVARASAAVTDARSAERTGGLHLQGLMARAGEQRGLLADMERKTVGARDRVRMAEQAGAAAEVAELQARLGLEAIRESLLLELAGLGELGIGAVTPWRSDGPGDAAGGSTAAAGTAVPAAPSSASEDALGTALAAALDETFARWRTAGQGIGPHVPQEQASAPPSAGRLNALRRRYQELGASNPFAAEEYAEVNARLIALEGQRADLDAAIDSTQQLIGQLSVLIREQFRATFVALEGAFARQFERLFDGGEAQLSLTAPDDLSSTGVEITARPPGKKRQALAMLSGGERALTAVALLFAMLEVRPVPFCVLDEVDAALDEANVSRFAAALRDLAEGIQFVVITHNRGTIEAADALYGVTIGDDAVSRVISLRLAQPGRVPGATAAAESEPAPAVRGH